MRSGFLHATNQSIKKNPETSKRGNFKLSRLDTHTNHSILSRTRGSKDTRQQRRGTFLRRRLATKRKFRETNADSLMGPPLGT